MVGGAGRCAGDAGAVTSASRTAGRSRAEARTDEREVPRYSRRPPRVLVATTLVEQHWPALGAWQDAVAAQETELLWDVAVTDGTDRPSPGYVDRLREWSRAAPFGTRHRVRLLRVGLDAEGLMFAAPGYKLAYARSLLWEKFTSWTSYEYLALLDVTIPPAPRTLQRLYESAQPWAVGLLEGSVRPLRHSLLRADVVRGVPFEIALDGDLEYVRGCVERGIYPALVPIG